MYLLGIRFLLHYISWPFYLGSLTSNGIAEVEPMRSVTDS